MSAMGRAACRPQGEEKMVAEFRAFLLKHNVMAVAIGFILGAAVGKVVTALVTDLIMPIVGAFTPAGDWRTMTVQLGNATFLVGDFLGALPVP